MKRPRFDQAACDTLAGCVKEVEEKTDAELVIVVRARSASYAHADYLFGFIVSFLVLLVVLFSPYEFHQIWVPIDVCAAFAAGALISSRSHTLRRLFSTSKYRSRAARAAAAAMFYEAGIANTNDEVGVIVYLSLLERRLELIADRGVLKRVPAQEWNQALFDLHQAGRAPDPQQFQKVLKNFGEMLATHLPATGENPNELPDMPRFELK